MVVLRTYQTADGRTPFDEWLVDLKGVQARARIRARLARVQAGNLVTASPCVRERKSYALITVQATASI